MTDTQRTVRALVVDDEADIRELIDMTLARMAIETRSVATLADARAELRDTTFDLCLTDMRLPDGDGIDLVRAMDKLQPNCPTAVITAYGSADTAVASLKAGAFDFVSKPIDIAVLRRLAAQALKLPDTHTDTVAPNTRPSSGPELIGDTRVMRHLRTMIAKLARSQAPVHVTGESGTGKELVARSIHARGARADAAFVPVNCGAIPGELMESEFFGYRKGAFTGATHDRDGLVQRSHGGTLFLDEVGALPLAMQVKLLRVIQERAARPVGATSEQPVDMRVISATHLNLADEVRAGRFREDLFYRLNVIEVIVPPLRERRDDIAALAEATLQRLTTRLRLTTRPRLSEDALAALHEHAFPGNIRELENMLERAVTLSDDDLIDTSVLRLQSPLAADAASTCSGGTAANGDLETQLESVERTRIQTALEANRYNKTQAARDLGITFRALRYRMAKLDME